MNWLEKEAICVFAAFGMAWGICKGRIYLWPFFPSIVIFSFTVCQDVIELVEDEQARELINANHNIGGNYDH